MPRAMAVVLFVHAILLSAVGAYLFVAPQNAMSLWPWPLTPLTGRAVGAWALGLGVAAAHALWESDLRRVRVAAAGYAAIGVLQGLALARFPDTVEWGEAQASVYVVVLASMIVVGLWLLWGARPSVAVQRKKTPEN
jgi:hypothetical protein